MKNVFIILLSILTFTVNGQRIKNDDIIFNDSDDITASIKVLNDMRKSKALVKEKTGITLDYTPNPSKMILDSSLCELARKRVIEMFKNDHIGHGTKIKEMKKMNGYMENCSMNYELSAYSHIIQQIIDKGVRSKGHRFNLLNYNYDGVGFAVGYYEGKTICCIIMK